MRGRRRVGSRRKDCARFFFNERRCACLQKCIVGIFLASIGKSRSMFKLGRAMALLSSSDFTIARGVENLNESVYHMFLHILPNN